MSFQYVQYVFALAVKTLQQGLGLVNHEPKVTPHFPDDHQKNDAKNSIRSPNGIYLQ
jgi:hypothetical protein